MALIVLKRKLTTRELAVLSLLWGYCPRESYKSLVKDTTGLTVDEVIAQEAKRVARVRAKVTTKTPT